MGAKHQKLQKDVEEYIKTLLDVSKRNEANGGDYRNGMANAYNDAAYDLRSILDRNSDSPV